MKLAKTFALALILVITYSCNTTQLYSVVDKTAFSSPYQKPLIVTLKYYSNESSFKQLFSSNINAHQQTTGINIDLVSTLHKKFKQQGIENKLHYIKTSIEEASKPFLNSRKNEDQFINDEIIEIINKENIDLLIKVIPSQIERVYKSYPGTVGANGLMTGGSSTKSVRFNYTVTAIDIKTEKEIWKGTYHVENPGVFKNESRRLAKQLNERFIQDNLLDFSF